MPCVEYWIWLTCSFCKVLFGAADLVVVFGVKNIDIDKTKGIETEYPN